MFYILLLRCTLVSRKISYYYRLQNSVNCKDIKTWSNVVLPSISLTVHLSLIYKFWFHYIYGIRSTSKFHASFPRNLISHNITCHTITTLEINWPMYANEKYSTRTKQPLYFIIPTNSSPLTSQYNTSRSKKREHLKGTQNI